MRFDKLTLKSQEALQEAQSTADRKGHQLIEPMHLAWALVDQSEGVLRPILQKLGANHNRLLKEIDAALGKMSQVQGGAMQSYMGPELKKVFDIAFCRSRKDARRLCQHRASSSGHSGFEG